MELRCVGAALWRQLAHVPRRPGRAPRLGATQWRVPAGRTAGQELHLRLGAAEEGPASAEDHVPRTSHLPHHIAQWPLRSGRDLREHIPVGGVHREPSGHPEPPLPGRVMPAVHGGQQPLHLRGQGLPSAGLEPLQLWEVSSGELLLSVLFDVGILAVTMDLAEHYMFCGGSDGSIFQVNLCTWPGQREKSFQPEQEHGKVFRGHRNQVTCLSVSTDGSVLLSGSHDETVRLWDVQSQQCLRTVTLKGPVTNACIMLAPISMLSSDFRPGLPLPHFNKHLLGAEHGDEPHRGGLMLRLGLHQQGSEPSYLERVEQLQAVMSSTLEKNVLGGQDQLRIRVTELEDEVRNLRKINRDLFDFSTRIITHPTK
ncbi:WD repeat-containing protein 18 isoform X2 [Ovis aries]|uniref:WD repeat-containing protein 18 isoform X2 n=1 Tax=Ovis aries TaxID=9940 RepID=UPI0005FB7046|nr:WD repeat-containing protein 18 isoform X2 [Ovis aries]